MADNGKVNIHGKEYETVASRVQKFREKYANHGIITEIISRDETTVVMKASITYEGTVYATGHAEETRASSSINRTSALENCETSAIGRALAAFGFAGTEYASADEVAGAIKQQGSYSKPGKPPATDKQKALIAKKLAEEGIAKDDMKAWLSENYGINGEMSIEDAKMIIDDLLHPEDNSIPAGGSGPEDY